VRRRRLPSRFWNSCRHARGARHQLPPRRGCWNRLQPVAGRGQPPAFLFKSRNIYGPAREAYHHLIPESVERVVGPTREARIERERKKVDSTTPSPPLSDGSWCWNSARRAAGIAASMTVISPTCEGIGESPPRPINAPMTGLVVSDGISTWTCSVGSQTRVPALSREPKGRVASVSGSRPLWCLGRDSRSRSA
jgi:hypothetical protein